MVGGGSRSPPNNRNRYSPQRSRSPRRHSRSPRRHSRSPRRHSRSPRRSPRRSRSPHRDYRNRDRSPAYRDRRSRSPPNRDQRNEQQNFRDQRNEPDNYRRPGDSHSYNDRSGSPRFDRSGSPRLSRSDSNIRSRSPSRNSRHRDNSPYHSRRSPGNHRRSPGNHRRSPDHHRRSPGNHRRSPDHHRRSPDRYRRSPDRYRRSPDNYTRSSDNYTRQARSPLNRNSRDPSHTDTDFYNHNHPAFSERQENSSNPRNSTSGRDDTHSNYRVQPQSFHDNRTGEGRNGTNQDGGPANLFQNDGSFMEMFKRKLDAQKKEEEAKSQATEQKTVKKSLLFRKIPQKKPKPLVAGAKKAPTKKKPEPTDSAWAAYMREVESYKTNSCADDDRFSRPLCK